MKLYKIKKSNIDKKGRGLYATKILKKVLELLIMLEKLLQKNKQKSLKNLIMQNLSIYLI